MNWQYLGLVFLGSGIGGGLRYLISALHNHFSVDTTKHFIPILTVNIIGSFLIGAFFAFAAKHFFSEKISLFLMTGILGGFTTYSSFSLDVLQLIQRGQVVIVVTYIVCSILLGVGAVFFGYWIAQQLLVN